MNILSFQLTEHATRFTLDSVLRILMSRYQQFLHSQRTILSDWMSLKARMAKNENCLERKPKLHSLMKTKWMKINRTRVVNFNYGPTCVDENFQFISFFRSRSTLMISRWKTHLFSWEAKSFIYVHEPRAIKQHFSNKIEWFHVHSRKCFYSSCLLISAPSLRLSRLYLLRLNVKTAFHIIHSQWGFSDNKLAVLNWIKQQKFFSWAFINNKNYENCSVWSQQGKYDKQIVPVSDIKNSHDSCR